MSKRRRTNQSSSLLVKDAPIRYDNNNILTSLPFELFGVNILCEFLTLSEMAVFDVALSNRSLRAYFAQVYACVLLSNHTVIKFDATARWMRARGIRGKHFDLWHGITRSNLMSFFRTGAQWESLNLTGYDYLNDAMLAKLSTGSPRLRNLNLAYCSDISDVGVRSLAANCRELENLVLWGCYGLTNDAVGALAASCPRIQHLNLRCCRKITDEGLMVIAKGFSSMQTLNFTYCKTITDAGVFHLAEKFPTLSRISFAYCVEISDTSVRHLARWCPQLEALDLTNCNISDESLVYIANSPMSQHLRELHISICTKVTDYGIQQLGAKCRELTSLYIAGCDQITMTGLRSLPAACVVHNPA
jgi:hypothetical protein